MYIYYHKSCCHNNHGLSVLEYKGIEAQYEAVSVAGGTGGPRQSRN